LDVTASVFPDASDILLALNEIAGYEDQSGVLDDFESDGYQPYDEAGAIALLKEGDEELFVDLLPEDRRTHILVGDGPGSGGHLWPGQDGKSTFPKDWNGDKIVNEISDIATDPSTQWYAQTGTGGELTKSGKPAKWVAWETRDSVRIRVEFEPATGRIVTSFPDDNPIPNLKTVE
jgi:filamentous hemagglutinin